MTEGQILTEQGDILVTEGGDSVIAQGNAAIDRTPIETKRQTIELTAVTNIIVTEAVYDPGNGSYIREFRVTGAAQIPLFILRVAAIDRVKVEVTPPQQGSEP